LTTIVYRDGVLAADTQAMAGDNKLGSVIKIARNKNGDLAGAAGLATYNYAFIRWFTGMESGEPPKATKDDNSYDRAVIFRKTGRIEVYEPTGMYIVASPYYAFGSGKPEALGALFAGADAELAVRAAMAHDSGTGGEVTVLRHE
jgi:ATP-dependent HslUV protease subunit HslV